MDLAIGGEIKFATADEDKGLGTGETDYGIFASASKTLIPELIGVASIGYTFVKDPSYINLENVFNYGLEFIYTGLVENLSLHANVFGNSKYSKEAVGFANKSNVYWGLGAYYYFTESIRMGCCC